MDQLSGMFDGVLQPVLRLGMIAIALILGFWVGIQLVGLDGVADLKLDKTLGEALGRHDPAELGKDVQIIVASFPQFWLAWITSVWRFPFAIVIIWLVFRVVVAESGALQLASVMLAVQAAGTYAVVGVGTGKSVAVLMVLFVGTLTWQLWSWWRETHWVEALDGPAYVAREQREAAEEGATRRSARAGARHPTAADASLEDAYQQALAGQTGDDAAEADPYAAETARELEGYHEAPQDETAAAIAALYADDSAGRADARQEIPGETEEERYDRLRMAREAQEAETRARLLAQRKGHGHGPAAGKGKGRR
ncbi:hypothetical protein DB346_17515 [Verrucomicrobia bacterium LW23]|nr:hypothetical protein DB346_17515 [Verrucomicrobia bacterium LW23]